MAIHIFRKVALERISSPEQLDQLITITNPLGWLSLLAISSLLLTAIFWGIYGSIPTQVQGQGIILKQEGIVSVQVQNSGKITQLNVEVGAVVEQGQIIARLEQNELLEQIRTAQLDLKNLEMSFEEQKKTTEEAKNIRLQELQQREINQNQHIRNLEIQVNTQYELQQQKQKLKNSLEQLAEEGRVSKSKILEIENEIIGIQQDISTLKIDIENARNQLNAIVLEIKKIESPETIDELIHAQQIEKAKLEIETLQKTFTDRSQIISPYRGRVLEISKEEGDLVNPGIPLVLMEKIGENTELEVITFFSPLTGKQVKKGMQAQISPSTVKQEEFGFMEGLVSEVDEYPSTFTTIMKTLQNEALAKMLIANFAPIKVKISLIADTNTPSGYKWSSRSGPPIDIQSGTICDANITTQEQAPITLVIPILRKFLFGV